MYSALNKDLYNLETVKIHSSKSLKVKKFYLESDEFDLGIRKILNYGHTFAHAIETVVENKISHGNATALGMNLANYYSLKNDLISSEFYKLHYQFFYSFSLIQVLTDNLYINIPFIFWKLYSSEDWNSLFVSISYTFFK